MCWVLRERCKARGVCVGKLGRGRVFRGFFFVNGFEPNRRWFLPCLNQWKRFSGGSIASVLWFFNECLAKKNSNFNQPPAHRVITILYERCETLWFFLIKKTFFSVREKIILLNYFWATFAVDKYSCMSDAKWFLSPLKNNTDKNHVRNYISDAGFYFFNLFKTINALHKKVQKWFTFNCQNWFK